MTTKNIPFRNSRIREDQIGRICLNDIHRAAGFSKNRKPNDWRHLRNTSDEMLVVLAKEFGKPNNYTKEEIKSIISIKRGSDTGMWAHKNLALAYAAFLSPRLAVEIREIFLRYKVGDESLGSEIRENNKKQRDVLREEHRSIGKKVRKTFTDALKEHGVSEPFQYAQCTNEIYKPILGGTAKKIKNKKRLPNNSNLRDSMSTSELAFTMAAEALATERIDHVEASGFLECQRETRSASNSIGTAIDSDRKNRQEKLV